MSKNYLVDGPKTASHTYIFAHGAGAPMDAPFMNVFASGLGKAGIRVVRFEFPYMERRRLEGRQFPPDRLEKLLQSWRDAIQNWRDGILVIGGKSMGGRIASMIAVTKIPLISGVVCLGYPFHPPGKPENLRIAHLSDLNMPTLICQGERDPFGGCDEIEALDLPGIIEFHWLLDGDHSFKPRIASGLTVEQNLESAVEKTASFIKSLK